MADDALDDAPDATDDTDEEERRRRAAALLAMLALGDWSGLVDAVAVDLASVYGDGLRAVTVSAGNQTNLTPVKPAFDERLSYSERTLKSQTCVVVGDSEGFLC